MSNRSSFVVSLIGRPNVGKSTLFNRLQKRANKAITYDMPGVTRDRNYALVKLDYLTSGEENEMILVDTGGFLPDAKLNEQIAGEFFAEMIEHAKLAIEESDLVLLVTDARQGPTPHEQEIVQIIRQQHKTFWVVANKCDSDAQDGLQNDFYSYGVNENELFPVSAAHGVGIYNLGEAIQNMARKGGAAYLQKGVFPREKVITRLAIIGTPNAGKSTILNRLLGEERALVSPVAGTTVDPIEGFFDLYFGKDALILEDELNMRVNDRQLFNQYQAFREAQEEMPLGSAEELIETEVVQKDEFSVDGIDETSDFIDIVPGEEISELSSDEMIEELFADNENVAMENEDQTAQEAKTLEGSLWRTVHVIDTAGIRKQKAIDSFIEQQAVYRALRCISEADIVLLMVDATKGLVHQERRLIDIALEKGKSIIIGLNKFDLLKRQLNTPQKRKEWMEDLRYHVPWLRFVDMIPMSAKYGEGMGRLKQALKQTIMLRYRRIPTSGLNRALVELLDAHPIILPGTKGKNLKLKYASMVKNGPATFLLFTNGSKGIPVSYRRYLVNGIRKQFGLVNGPVHLVFKSAADLLESPRH